MAKRRTQAEIAEDEAIDKSIRQRDAQQIMGLMTGKIKVSEDMLKEIRSSSGKTHKEWMKERREARKGPSMNPINNLHEALPPWQLRYGLLVPTGLSENYAGDGFYFCLGGGGGRI